VWYLRVRVREHHHVFVAEEVGVTLPLSPSSPQQRWRELSAPSGIFDGLMARRIAVPGPLTESGRLCAAPFFHRRTLCIRGCGCTDNRPRTLRQLTVMLGQKSSSLSGTRAPPFLPQPPIVLAILRSLCIEHLHRSMYSSLSLLRYPYPPCDFNVLNSPPKAIHQRGAEGGRMAVVDLLLHPQASLPISTHRAVFCVSCSICKFELGSGF
jgi:hypothetical protein